MLNKTVIALSAAIFLSTLGASSFALAADRGGYVPPVHSKQLLHKKVGNAEGRNAYGSAALDGRNTRNDANIAIQDQFFSRSLGD